MASYVLYIVTGVVLALMAARQLLALRHTLPKPDNHSRPLNTFHVLEGKGIVWAEAALCGVIFLFGLWLVLTAGLLFIASLLHSF
jgi:hypothetical protein